MNSVPSAFFHLIIKYLIWSIIVDISVNVVADANTILKPPTAIELSDANNAMAWWAKFYSPKDEKSRISSKIIIKSNTIYPDENINS